MLYKKIINLTPISAREDQVCDYALNEVECYYEAVQRKTLPLKVNYWLFLLASKKYIGFEDSDVVKAINSEIDGKKIFTEKESDIIYKMKPEIIEFINTNKKRLPLLWRQYFKVARNNRGVVGRDMFTYSVGRT
jgi:hypothetical protein